MSERQQWEARHAAAEPHDAEGPSPWVMRQARILATGARIVDLAAGRGRHAVPLARAGYRVVAVDIADAAVHAARAAAPHVDGIVADAAHLPLRDACADAVLCVRFLDRALFPHLHRLLRPGGRLILETFTREHLRLGTGPRSPAHLLEAGELPSLVGPLQAVEYREGYVASIVAVNGPEI
jgi:SAM-dependent methyltransferase